MSTDMQRYSLENQSEAIALYAAQHGLTIVRSYEDVGKSGLRFDGRNALKCLIDDVKSKRAGFRVILVYDVSRWGRFQDSDEAAHYEFICKQAGVAVEYCAEQFENDGSLTATVLKNIKRAMAGEYSRELSVKVHAGQCRIAALGFRRGSAPGYGLRRQLVDANGQRKAQLEPGEWKNISTDRITLVPGLPQELETIRQIYRMFTEERMSLNGIAARLNAEGKTNSHGRPWLPTAVHDVLSNEKYIGNNVLNITSVTLGGKWRRNPPSQWIRANNAFEPIVPRDLFDKAQRILQENHPYTRNELLDFLTATWCRSGTISVDALAAFKGGPSAGAYQRCFGGLMNAYELVGFVKPRVKSWAKNQRYRTAMNAYLIESIQGVGGSAKVLPGGYILRINDELSLGTSIVRLVTTDHADRRWIFGYKTRRRPDILIVGRVAEGQEELRDYFCLPYIFLGRNWLTFSEGKPSGLDPFQMSSLAPLAELFARDPIEAARQRMGQSVPLPNVSDPASRHSSAWPGAKVEDAISGVMDMVGSMVGAPSFLELLSAQGFQTVPRLLSAPKATHSAKAYLPSLLDFAVAWGFVSGLMANREIASRVDREWPLFVTEMKMTYLSILTQGPIARLPHAITSDCGRAGAPLAIDT